MLIKQKPRKFKILNYKIILIENVNYYFKKILFKENYSSKSQIKNQPLSNIINNSPNGKSLSPNFPTLEDLNPGYTNQFISKETRE